MKSSPLLLVVFSLSCNANQKPLIEKQEQPPAPMVIRAEVDPDRGPEILKIFSTQLLPGFVDMAEGHSLQNPQQEKVGMSQFAKGLMAFVSLVVSEATRRPGMGRLSLFTEESLTNILEKALTSPEGRESLESWQKSLHNLAKTTTHNTYTLAS